MVTLAGGDIDDGNYRQQQEDRDYYEKQHDQDEEQQERYQ